MSKEQIISKGKYPHPQPDTIVGVKQYLFVRDEDGKKRLLLRFCNNRNEICTKFAFTLYRLDVKGNVLGEERFESADREYGAKEDFAFDQRIDVEEKCTDFLVKVAYAKYGQYTHLVENNEVSVNYSDKKPELQKKGKGGAKAKARKINERSFEMSWTFAVISVIILALAFAATGFLLKDFKETESDFSLAGVHYKFSTEAKDSLTIVGCSSNYREITLASEVDGYKVVGVEPGAFKSNSSLRKITIDGIAIDDNAFSGCEKLQAVEIENVTSIGAYAFLGCKDLETVEIKADNQSLLLSIGTEAFGSCKSLKTVEINQLVSYGNKVDYFKGSTEIKELTLKNFAFTMKDTPSKFVGRLGLLFGETGVTESGSKLETLVIENMDRIPEGFASGFKKLKSVTVNDGDVKIIGSNAFKDCVALNTVALKAQAEEIGSSAFVNTAISSFDLSKVRVLGASVFKGASKLSSVTGLGQGGVDNIPKNTFEGCVSLSTVAINNNIVKINAAAFKNSGLTKLSIPAGATCDTGILAGCAKLTELEIYELEAEGFIGKYFGVTKEEAAEGTRAIPGTLHTVTVGAGSVISEYAFAGCSGLVTVNLPDGITSFGNYAFYDCQKLKGIKIPGDGLTYVGDYAFAHTLIETVNLPSTVEYIGYGALSGCMEVKELTLPFLGKNATDSGAVAHIFGASISNSAGAIPVTLKKIVLASVAPMVALPKYAFANCAGALEISIPSTISVIEEGAYYGCAALTNIDATNITRIDASAFADCKALSTISLGQNLTAIGDKAFENTAITILQIPDSVTKLGNGVIKGCNKLISLTVPFIGSTPVSVEDATIAHLSGCVPGSLSDMPKALNTITVTRQFTGNRVPDNAFNGCESLTSLILPGGITAIGNFAFAHCKGITSYNLDGIAYIGTNAFASSGLVSVVIPSGIETIGEGVFANCEGLTSIQLSDTVKSIGAHAFENTAITEIAISDKVIRISNYAFSGSKLKSITLPAKLLRLGTRAFSGCYDLVEMTFPLTGDFFEENLSIGEYLFGEVIPENVKSITINGSYGKMLYTDAFIGSAYVEEIILDTDSIVSIDEGAFAECGSLRYVSIPSSVKSIASSAFGSSYHLYEISNDSDCDIESPYVLAITTSSTRAPMVKKDGLTFAMYEGLWYLINYEKSEKIVLCDSFEYDGEIIDEYIVPDHLFFDDDTLKEITFSRSVKSIGKRLFQSCAALTSVSFAGNNSIAEIKESSFAYCTELKSVVLPSSVQIIWQDAFLECSSLASVELPQGLRKIDKGAFYNCASLGSVKLYEDVYFIGEEAFFGCYALYDVYSLCGLNIKAGSKDHGYVARYAAEVHGNMGEGLSEVVTISGIGTFRRGASEWLLMYGEDRESLVIDSFEYEGKTVSNIRISTYAFSGCEKIKTLVIGDAVKQIQEGAFCDCTGLVSVDMSKNSSLQALEKNAFASCSSLRTVDLADTIETIAESVFYDCVMLESIHMPSSLGYIGTYAFSNCARLVSVTINENVYEISAKAFFGCNHLYEVINLSSHIEVEAGDDSHGRVGLFAKKIFTTNKGFERYEQGGIKLFYVDAEETWYLYAFEDKGDKIVDVKNLGGSLVILPYAFQNGTFAGIALPSNLRLVDYDAFNSCYSLNNVYFGGTESQWDNVEFLDMSTFFDVYYYEACVHFNSRYKWTYDKNGQVSTVMCEETSEITKKPTCYESGIRTFSCACEGCDYTRTKVEDKLEHSFTDGICANCGYVIVNVDENSVGQLVDAGIIEMKDFKYDTESGAFVSLNKENDSRSYFKIKADGVMEISFEYEASSETRKDYLVVYVNGIRNGRISGQNSDDFKIVLDEGETLIVSYEKNGEISANNDCGYIRDLVIIKEPDESGND